MRKPDGKGSSSAQSEQDKLVAKVKKGRSHAHKPGTKAQRKGETQQTREEKIGGIETKSKTTARRIAWKSAEGKGGI